MVGDKMEMPGARELSGVQEDANGTEEEKDE